MLELASKLCTKAGSLILRGKSSRIKGLIVYLLIVKCWHNFCYIEDALPQSPLA